jgi:hypothetical protein
MTLLRPYWCLLFLILGLPGCGDSNRGDLSGEVTLDGSPVESGAILLVPLDATGGTLTGGAIDNGKFSLTGKQAPAVGLYRVEIRASRKTGRLVQKAMGAPGERAEETAEGVAARFNSASELTVEIKRGVNEKNFAVTSN